MNLIN
ncbi:hypothetical protein HU200_009948 [Digitaria exilis]